jgi:probable HAF family extracellular repeat protein
VNVKIREMMSTCQPGRLRLALAFCGLAFLQSITANSDAVAQQPAANATYTVIDLGVDATPNDVNGNGEVVGAITVAPYTTAGFYFDVVSGITELPGTREAFAINDAGVIVGSTSAGGAFLISGSKFVDLGTDHTATDINEVGQAAGSESKPNPFRPAPLPTDVAIYDSLSRKWSAWDVAQVYPRGTRQGVYADLYRSTGINDLGFLVGVKSRYGLYGSSSIMAESGSNTVTFLPIPGGGEARAINNFNQVVGRTGVIDGVYTAYVYDVVSGTLSDLGTLAGGTYSVAYDINDNAEVVGNSSGRGFIWKNGQMSDLNSLLEPGTSWLVTSAQSINAQGDIAAIGTLNGETHGLLLLTSDPGNGGGENQAPVASITTNRIRGRAPLRIKFDGTGSSDPDGTISQYAWDFGDGGTSDLGKVNHDYTTAGIYTATLTVNDNGGLSSAASITITVR